MTHLLALILGLALLFVWPLPGTIALRHALLVLTLALLAVDVLRLRRALPSSLAARAWPPSCLAGIASLVALTVWFVLQAVFVSSERAWALAELRGQWLPAIAAGGAGLLLAQQTVRRGATASRRLHDGIIAVLAALTTIPVVLVVASGKLGGAFEGRIMPLIGGKLEMSVVVISLLTFLAAELLAWLTGRSQRSRPALALMAAAGVAALLNLWLAGARNGIVGVGFLVAAVMLILMIENRRRNAARGRHRLLLPGALLLAGALAVGLASYKSDDRWQLLGRTAAVAWDIDNHRQWLNPEGVEWPRLAHVVTAPAAGTLRFVWAESGSGHTITTTLGKFINGGVTALAVLDVPGQGRQHVIPKFSGPVWALRAADGATVQAGQPIAEIGRQIDGSAYLRIAFIHAGLRLLAEEPLGVGYGRNAFGHALEARWPTRVGHAHSGLIDLAAAAGIPGLLLWGLFTLALLGTGWRAFRQAGPGDTAGLALLLLAAGFTVRMAIDSVARDHMLQTFLFLVGVLLVLAAGRRERFS